jgi:hypothetical protein
MRPWLLGCLRGIALAFNQLISCIPVVPHLDVHPMLIEPFGTKISAPALSEKMFYDAVLYELL